MIACLIIPYFPAAVERRDSDRLAQEVQSLRGNGPTGLIIGGQPWEPQPVYSYSWEVARQGVKPGMSLRLAHFLSPQAHFLPADPPRYVSAAGEIGDILTGFTHLLEPESLWSQGDGKNYFGRRLPARYTLDLESLPAVEALDLSQEMGRVVRRETRLGPAIGLGENKFVAQIAASLTRSNHARPVGRGDEARFLASQSIHFLPLDKETRRRLNLLGIRTLGQLTALPRASLLSHLNLDDRQGKLFAQLGQIVKGGMDPALAWLAFDSPLISLEPKPANKKEERLTFHFDPPLANSNTLERVLERGAAELAGRLQKKRQESRRLDLILEGCGGETDNIYTKLVRRSPTSNRQQLLDSLRELLAQAKEQAIGLSQDGYYAGFSALTLILLDLNPAAAGQLSLFDPPKSSNSLQEIVARLSAKYALGAKHAAKSSGANFGGEAFFRPAPADLYHPLLERRFRLDPLVGAF